MDTTSFWSAVVQANDDDASRLIVEHAALAWTIEMAIAARLAQIGHVTDGMGVDGETIVLPERGTLAERLFVLRMGAAYRHRWKTWRGLDLRHLPNEQLETFIALDKTSRRLSQDVFDFIVLADRPNRKLDSRIGIRVHGETPLEVIRNAFSWDDDAVNLMQAFQRQLLAEASGNPPVTGAFVMAHEPLEVLDRELRYDSLRLVVYPEGVVGSIVCEDEFVPFAWEPNRLNTIKVWVHPRAAFAFDLLMACIWHDLCVVRERWSERTGRSVKRRGVHSMPTTPKRLYLPRTIHHVTWGQATDREVLDRQFRAAHAVRGFYRVLPEGREARAAGERASEYGFPPPPDGYTFVRPHVRGQGEIQKVARQIVCTGLSTARVILGQ